MSFERVALEWWIDKGMDILKRKFERAGLVMSDDYSTFDDEGLAMRHPKVDEYYVDITLTEDAGWKRESGLHFYMRTWFEGTRIPEKGAISSPEEIKKAMNDVVSHVLMEIESLKVRQKEEEERELEKQRRLGAERERFAAMEWESFEADIDKFLRYLKS